MLCSGLASCYQTVLFSSRYKLILRDYVLLLLSLFFWLIFVSDMPFFSAKLLHCVAYIEFIMRQKTIRCVSHMKIIYLLVDRGRWILVN